MGLLSDKKEKNSVEKRWWDPFIYPDSGYIPPCRVCKQVHDDYLSSPARSDIVIWPHALCGCLWSSYFQEKVLKVNHHAVFVKSK